jgi:hypothetical protein
VLPSYPTDALTATMPKRNFLEEFEEAARAKVSELLQTYLEQEADALHQAGAKPQASRFGKATHCMQDMLVITTYILITLCTDS